MSFFKRYLFIVLTFFFVQKEGYACFNFLFSDYDQSKSPVKLVLINELPDKPMFCELPDKPMFCIFKFLDAESLALSAMVSRNLKKSMGNYLKNDGNILKIAEAYGNTPEDIRKLLKHIGNQRLRELALSYDFYCEDSTPINTATSNAMEWRPYAKLLKVLKEENVLSKGFELIRSHINKNKITTLSILYIFEFSDNANDQEQLLQGLKKSKIINELHRLEKQFKKSKPDEFVSFIPSGLTGSLDEYDDESDNEPKEAICRIF